MPMKVWFIIKVHNKIQTNQKKNCLKGCKTNNKIQTKQKQFQNEIWYMMIYNS
jgi:hypothetical protein